MTALGLTAYRRVSTKGQIDGWGLPVQKDAITRRAQRDGIRIVKWETDEGITGTLDEEGRPALFRCLNAIKAGESRGLIIAEIGRFARELTVQEAVLAKVWSLGGIVVTADGGEILPDDPEDPMRTAMRQMAGVFMELDRKLVIKRLRNGRAAKKAAGGYAGGTPPYGTRAEDHELAPDDHELEVIGRMRHMRDDGMSYRVIAAKLNADSVPAPRGGTWHPMSVRRILAA